MLTELGGMLRENLVTSPTGDRVALFERQPSRDINRYLHRLIVVDIATGEQRTLAEAGDTILLSIAGRRSGAPLDRLPAWSPDGQFVYYLSEHDGRTEIMRARADGGGSELVIAPDGDIKRFALGVDGNGLVFEKMTPHTVLAAQRNRETREGFRVDSHFTPLYSLRPLPAEDAEAQVLWLDLANGQTRRAEDAEIALLEPAQNASQIRARTAAIAYNPPLELYLKAEEREIVCSAPACTGALRDAWAIGAPSERVIFRRLEGHARTSTALYVWSPTDNHVRLLRRAEDRLEGCTLADVALICLQDFSTQPRRLVRIDLRNGALRVLYDPNPHWRSFDLPRIERLDFTDEEGNQSFAQLVYPVGYRRNQIYPLAIVQYRARGFLNAGTGAEAPIFALAAQGMFVLAVDRPEFDRRGAQMTLLELTQQTALDGSEAGMKRRAILDFIDRLQQRDMIDPTRLGITGMSDGAETLFDMLLNAPIFRAAVSASPPTDPIAYELLSAHTRARRLAQLGFSPPWDEAGAFYHWWRENSVSLRGAPISAALMLNLTESEALRAFPMLARLENTTTPTETYLYPGAYHLKWRPSQIWASQERTMAWLCFWLLDRDPADRELASRWRSMRDRTVQSGSDTLGGAVGRVP